MSWVTSKQLITVSVVASAQVVFLHFGMQPNCKKSLYNLYITILYFHKIMLTVIYITILYLLLGSITFHKVKVIYHGGGLEALCLLLSVSLVWQVLSKAF